MFLSFLDPKLHIQPNIIWWGLAAVGLIIGTVVKVMTKNFLPRKEIEEKYVDQKVFNVQHEALCKDIGEIKKRTECVPKIKAGLDLLLKKNGLKTE